VLELYAKEPPFSTCLGERRHIKADSMVNDAYPKSWLNKMAWRGGYMQNEYIYISKQPKRVNMKSRFFEELSQDWEYKARKLQARRQRALKKGRIRRYRF
jgi:hypothetical protein